MRQNCVNHRFHPNTFLIYHSTGLMCYLHKIYMIFTVTTWLAGYAHDSFHIICNFQMQIKQIVQKTKQICRKIQQKKLSSAEPVETTFSKTALIMTLFCWMILPPQMCSVMNDTDVVLIWTSATCFSIPLEPALLIICRKCCSSSRCLH